MTMDDAAREERLAAERHAWVTTLRADGSAHTVPVWFTWHDGAVWFSTSVESVKAANLARDPRATVAIEGAEVPIVIEGEAALWHRDVGPFPADVVAAFAAKHDWDITVPNDYDDGGALVRIDVQRWLLGGPG